MWRNGLAKDFGDFQTPLPLVSSILETLNTLGKTWTRVLEPTCGQGNFIEGFFTRVAPPREIQGIEIQLHYVNRARHLIEQAPSLHITIERGNIFDINLQTDVSWSDKGSLLVVGNPPWVTNAGLGVLESKNLPQKTNLKGLSGLDARTGKANFDVAEYIWLKLIRELAAEQPTIALLCKTSVARNVLQHSYDANLPITQASLWKIDAKKWFHAAVDACLFCVQVGAGEPSYQASVYQDLYATQSKSIMGIVDGHIVADVDAHTHIFVGSNMTSVTWRQGVKHDAASAMELAFDEEGQFKNKLGEGVIVEPEYVYSLLKSSDLFHFDRIRPKKAVIVTHKKLGEDTRTLQQHAPQLWQYLTQHKQYFERRKSSIYENQPPFTMFGIGDYSFAPYKVAISGLHKVPKFRVIEPVNGRPVMLDDTCYFIPCSSLQEATQLANFLNDPVCLNYLNSIVFLDAKRPITKKLLQRIHIPSLIKRAEPDAVHELESIVKT